MLISFAFTNANTYKSINISIDFLPIKPIFKVYHYDWQYVEDKKRGIDNDKLKEDYLGVIIQSNWDEKRNSVYVKKKNILSRAVKKIKYHIGKN